MRSTTRSAKGNPRTTGSEVSLAETGDHPPSNSGQAIDPCSEKGKSPLSRPIVICIAVTVLPLLFGLLLLLLVSSSDMANFYGRIASQLHLPGRTGAGSLPASFLASSELSAWIETEIVVARRGVLANIGPGCGANDGLVIASPSKAEAADIPDYHVSLPAYCMSLREAD